MYSKSEHFEKSSDWLQEKSIGRLILLLLSLCCFLVFSAPLSVVATEKERANILNSNIDFEKRQDLIIKRYSELIQLMTRSDEATFNAFKHRSDGVAFSVLAEFVPWWTEEVTSQLTALKQSSNETVTSLFRRTVRHSSQIRVFAELPLIRQTAIQEADGAFDYRFYTGYKYSDIDEFVGNDLKTGGPARYKEHGSSLKYGIKKRFATGTEVDVGQTFESFDTNSIYLNPEEQAKAKTNLTITQPLLKGIGTDYNLSVIELAKVDHKASATELVRQMESHLLEVARAYWGLYMERAIMVQKQRLAKEINSVYKKLYSRLENDAQPATVARTKALLTSRQLDADRAEFAVYNAQSRLATLVEDVDLLSASGKEIVTFQAPSNYPFVLSLDKVFQSSLKNRKEIQASALQLHSAIINLNRAKNEILPDLDLFAQTYVDGLEGDYAFDKAYSDQFSEGRPSYNVGVRFEYPIGNNSAEARLVRRRIELRQMLHQLDLTVRNILLEVSVSYRNVIKNINEVASRYEIMQSSLDEIDDLTKQVDFQLSGDASYDELLYRLMDASERRAEAEKQFSFSQLTFNLSLISLRKAMGTLVTSQDISTETLVEDGLPVLKVHMK